MQAGYSLYQYIMRGGAIEMITFEDSVVEGICLAKFDYNGNGYMSKAEAASVTSLGTAFKGNTEITSFNEFEYFAGVSKISDTGWSNKNASFYGCTSLSSIKLPTALTLVGAQAFDGCTSLASINLDNVENIWFAAFYNCTSLTSVTLTSAKKILQKAFFGCTSLTRVTFQSIEKLIGGGSDEGTFYNCPITVIDLPATITSIGNYVFYRSSLSTLICRATNPPTMVSSSLYETKISNIYVPDASVDAYKTTSGWSEYADKIKPLSEYTE